MDRHSLQYANIFVPGFTDFTSTELKRTHDLLLRSNVSPKTSDNTVLDNQILEAYQLLDPRSLTTADGVLACGHCSHLIASTVPGCEHLLDEPEYYGTMGTFFTSFPRHNDCIYEPYPYRRLVVKALLARLEVNKTVQNSSILREILEGVQRPPCYMNVSELVELFRAAGFTIELGKLTQPLASLKRPRNESNEKGQNLGRSPAKTARMGL